MALQKTAADSEKSWSLPVAELDAETFDLSVKNPNAEEEAPLREPAEIIEEIMALDQESAAILATIRGLV